MAQEEALKILLVDDEPLARERLRTLLADIALQLPSEVVGEADNGLAALELLRRQPVDVVLADIRMPAMDGIELAGHLGALESPPAVIFVTAYDNYAVQAFDLNAVDYLLKPVRTQRLLTALQKVRGQPPVDPALLAGLGRELRGGGRSHLSCHERGRLLLVPVGEVLYFKADLKYVTARTQEREFLLDETLTHLETEFAERFIRLHRAVLVAKTALAGFEKAADDDAEAYGWALLRGVPERLPVSRRQWAAARQVAGG
ncbi:MAG: LytTR family DNA-binding domain-containing protein [Azonexus sp.]|jgi:two-component system response regulator AlgR|uniref:LytR/AlgR family response regulator transcription factor n=1 Tax=Azonexus sp. TaxID=1872668 RepID=UPI00281E29A8|nr:LytTR family DNA-binding domain-containing protein [Azonexus sp.]MDR0776655.1 LytTR family DNA-binding domain-containing protein [Azonexus sp.]